MSHRKQNRIYFKSVPMTFNYRSLENAHVAHIIAQKQEREMAHKQALLRMSQEDLEGHAYTSTSRQVKTITTPQQPKRVPRHKAKQYLEKVTFIK